MSESSLQIPARKLSGSSSTEEKLGNSSAKVVTISAPFWGIISDWEIENFELAEDFVSRSSLLPDVVLFHSIGGDKLPFNHLEKYMENLSSATVRQIFRSHHVFQEGLKELAVEIREA
ncbi:hypothetical protein A1A1_08209 [Planococcus antarcticus DSM 14505]|uniref:Alpha/beta hydrolase n=1 Tax=Planococcus antarcticus DSM 14505 TaxID=1185653 RepID=A0A1C7DKU0_9BACL|nr:hypothetical protein [Planococcus antarcticus]ANU11833.1 hypothetical protein BBH88_17045 [Planococcus antarcticus DSM 14505]EIM06936.1 hypothetical protein A1A1_08209 [Planococcus antarcticus DSM 14505]